MNNQHAEILKKHGLELSAEKMLLFSKYEQSFLEKNSRVNLISKNDEKFLFEKHVFDSLSINKLFKNELKKEKIKLLDIGTGGGFPSVPIALYYDDIDVYAIDSIGKKIKVIEELKDELGLKNLYPICERVENLRKKGCPIEYNCITTRAVAPMETVLRYALPYLSEDGFFVAYKSKKALEELEEAKKILKRNKAEVVEIVEYTLPLEEIYERNLIIVKKK